MTCPHLKSSERTEGSTEPPPIMVSPDEHQVWWHWDVGMAQLWGRGSWAEWKTQPISLPSWACPGPALGNKLSLPTAGHCAFPWATDLLVFLPNLSVPPWGLLQPPPGSPGWHGGRWRSPGPGAGLSLLPLARWGLYLCPGMWQPCRTPTPTWCLCPLYLCAFHPPEQLPFASVLPLPLGSVRASHCGQGGHPRSSCSSAKVPRASPRVLLRIILISLGDCLGQTCPGLTSRGWTPRYFEFFIFLNNTKNILVYRAPLPSIFKNHLFISVG